MKFNNQTAPKHMNHAQIVKRVKPLYPPSFQHETFVYEHLNRACMPNTEAHNNQGKDDRSASPSH